MLLNFNNDSSVTGFLCLQTTETHTVHTAASVQVFGKAGLLCRTGFQLKTKLTGGLASVRQCLTHHGGFLDNVA